MTPVFGEVGCFRRLGCKGLVQFQGGRALWLLRLEGRVPKLSQGSDSLGQEVKVPYLLCLRKQGYMGWQNPGGRVLPLLWHRKVTSSRL